MGNQEETAISKGQKLHEDLVELKRVERMHGGKTSLQIKFLNQNGKITFGCRERVFTSYTMC